jgi:hypothetical protein
MLDGAKSGLRAKGVRLGPRPFGSLSGSVATRFDFDSDFDFDRDGHDSSKQDVILLVVDDLTILEAQKTGMYPLQIERVLADAA